MCSLRNIPKIILKCIATGLETISGCLQSCLCVFLQLLILQSFAILTSTFSLSLFDRNGLNSVVSPVANRSCSKQNFAPKFTKGQFTHPRLLTFLINCFWSLDLCKFEGLCTTILIWDQSLNCSTLFVRNLNIWDMKLLLAFFKFWVFYYTIDVTDARCVNGTTSVPKSVLRYVCVD